MPSHTFKRLVWKTVHVAITQRPEMTDKDEINELYSLIYKKDLGLFLRPRWTVQVRLHPRNKRGKINIPRENQTMLKISAKIIHLGFGLLPFSQIS